MARPSDLTGRKFHRLLVLAKAPSASVRHPMWRCRCDCGVEKNVEAGNLASGRTKSCGCLMREKAPEHRRTHGSEPYRLYVIWLSMRARCSNPTNHSYKRYGGRGISVCHEWDAFEPFRDWALANGYSEALTIDRIENSGNYEPSNCRWATPKEQARNTRRNRAVVRSDGAQFDSIIAAAEATGCSQYHIAAVCRGKRKTAGGFVWSRAAVNGC